MAPENREPAGQTPQINTNVKTKEDGQQEKQYKSKVPKPLELEKDDIIKHRYKVNDIVHIITGQDVQATDRRTFAGAVHDTAGRYHVGIIRKVLTNPIDGVGRTFLVETSPGNLKRMSTMNIAPAL